MRAIGLCLLFLALCDPPRRASAGGLYLTPLGAEPAARAGARVAGISSPHALWYNPAGLAYSKRQLLFDLNLPLARGSFTRFVADGTTESTGRVRSVILPLPTLAYSDDFGLERFGFGVGLLVPPGYALDWPDEPRAAQRYSILSTDQSAFASLALGGAYRPLDALSLGVALYITAAQFGGDVALSACDYAFCSQPEAPEWQGRARFLLGPTVSATAVFGARYDLERARFGASVQIRSKISGETDFRVQLPDNSLFDGIVLQGKHGDDLTAEMSITLPTIVRLGAELDVYRPLTVELAATWENWSEQRNIDVRPIDVYARDVPGVGDVRAEPVTLARNIQDTWAVQLGGTHDLSQFMPHRRKLAAHAGIMYETSSLETRYLSPPSLDTQKVLLSAGASVELSKGVMLDLSYGHFFMRDHVVRNSRVLLPAAVSPVPTDENPDEYEAGDRPAIGNGRYALEADFVALGVRWLIDEARPRPGASTR